MSVIENNNLLQIFLNKQDDGAWAQVVETLMPSIHPVDQAATRIWFSFFPLKLARALKDSPDLAQTVRQLRLAGKCHLADQIDTSAEFLYGHRYWPEVKRAVTEYIARTAPASLVLKDHILAVARRAADELRVEESLLVGITAVAFMTYQQVGPAAFRPLSDSSSRPALWAKSPEQVLEARRKEPRGGLFSFLKSRRKEFTVTFRENDPAGRFKLINQQHLTTAAAKDTRDYKWRDPRCIEGPIPVECRSAACGTCWIGVLSGAEKLSEPEDLEIRKMKEFGYPGFRAEPGSIIRLACQAKCFGDVSIVIPPWNGVIGKLPTGVGGQGPGIGN